MEFLARVESTFSVAGRGLVLVPEKRDSHFRIRVGTSVELRTPDGRALKTRIIGVELLKPAKGPCNMAILITRDIEKGQIPPGTEIWYLRDDPASRPPSGPQPA